MALSAQEELQIAEIVARVLDAKLDDLKKDIVNGFVEAVDWHNENFARIMQNRNDQTLDALYKRERERIEIQTAQKQAEEEAEAEAERNRPKVGFTTSRIEKHIERNWPKGEE
jgi:hypothetical protein